MAVNIIPTEVRPSWPQSTGYWLVLNHEQCAGPWVQSINTLREMFLWLLYTYIISRAGLLCMIPYSVWRKDPELRYVPNYGTGTSFPLSCLCVPCWLIKDVCLIKRWHISVEKSAIRLIIILQKAVWHVYKLALVYFHACMPWALVAGPSSWTYHNIVDNKTIRV